MTPQERIEEVHGLWELAVARVCALAHALVERDPVAQSLVDAVNDERAAFRAWTDVSAEVAGAASRPTPKARTK